jgi:hypothetical protein
VTDARTGLEGKTMRAQGTACLVLMAAAVGICTSVAGCSSSGGAQAPAAGTLASKRQVDSHRHAQVTRSAQAPAAGTAAANGTPSAQTPQPPAATRKVSALLASGLYTDAPDGNPHYVLSFTARAGGGLRGSVSFLYQDGRMATAGSYAGTLSGSGKITLTLADGKALSGSYASGHLTLAGCAAALPLATVAGDCTFTYHGHVP